MPQQPRSSRRKFLRNVAGASAAAAAPALGATSATSPSTQPDMISSDDIAAMARLTGHDYAADEIKLMIDGVDSNRDKLKSLHTRTIDPRIEPALTFDPRLPGVEYPAGESSFALSEAAPIPYNGDPTTLAFANVADLSRLIHAHKITSVELTKMYLHRLDTIGRRLNAVVTLTRDLALRQAERFDRELALGHSRGALHGIPYGAKDLLATAGIPTTWGVKPLEKQVFDYNATAITKLEEAGAVLCSKLSLGELAMGDTWFGGQTKSPWNEKQGSSGSSAGPAATVASGCVAFAVGSETMGSIISPCMTNGVTGLRPTYGRISRYGAMALSRTMDKLGPMTRGVEDAAIVLNAIHGDDDLDPTAVKGVGFRWNPKSDLKHLRVGYDVVAFEQIGKSKSAAKRSVYEQALSRFRGLAGGEMKPIHLPPVDQFKGIAGLIIAVESASSFTELVESGKVRELVQQGEGAWPNSFRCGSLIPASDYLRAMQVRTQLMRAMHEVMKDVDVYVTVPYSGPTIAYTNTTGHPSLVTRCGLVDERPVLIELIAQPYREDAALRLAFAYERETSWGDKWPAV